MMMLTHRERSDVDTPYPNVEFAKLSIEKKYGINEKYSYECCVYGSEDDWSISCLPKINALQYLTVVISYRQVITSDCFKYLF